MYCCFINLKWTVYTKLNQDPSECVLMPLVDARPAACKAGDWWFIGSVKDLCKKTLEKRFLFDFVARPLRRRVQDCKVQKHLAAGCWDQRCLPRPLTEIETPRPNQCWLSVTLLWAQWASLLLDNGTANLRSWRIEWEGTEDFSNYAGSILSTTR